MLLGGSATQMEEDEEEQIALTLDCLGDLAALVEDYRTRDFGLALLTRGRWELSCRYASAVTVAYLSLLLEGVRLSQLPLLPGLALLFSPSQLQLLEGSLRMLSLGEVTAILSEGLGTFANILAATATAAAAAASSRDNVWMERSLPSSALATAPITTPVARIEAVFRLLQSLCGQEEEKQMVLFDFILPGLLTTPSMPQGGSDLIFVSARMLLNLCRTLEGEVLSYRLGAVFSLLNRCSSPQQHSLFIDAWTSSLTLYQSDPFFAACLRAACRVIADAPMLAIILDQYLWAFFDQSSASHDWSLCVENVEIPEIDEDEFMGHAMRSGLALPLIVYGLQLMQHAWGADDAQAQVEREKIAGMLTEWCLRSQALAEREQAALPLLWTITVTALCRTVAQHPTPVLVSHINQLSVHLASLGEDRKSGAGVLSWIGLGEKNPRQVRLRTCAKILGIYLSLLLSESGYVRLGPLLEQKPPRAALRSAASLQTQSTQREYTVVGDLLKVAHTILTNPAISTSQCSSLVNEVVLPMVTHGWLTEKFSATLRPLQG